MEPFEEMYFEWLCAKTLSQDPHVRNYYGLLEVLYRTEYVWIVPLDENRAEDGLELRDYFLTESRQEKDKTWYESPCSVLEVLLAFANRASFQTDLPVRDWFWKFLTYLGLSDYRRVSDGDIPEILSILNRWMNGEIEYNGRGGILPLTNPKRDQSKIEMWWQFCDYVVDQGMF